MQLVRFSTSSSLRASYIKHLLITVSNCLSDSTITSNTRAYGDTLRDAGLQACIIIDKLKRYIYELEDPFAREDIQRRARKYAWDKYSPEKSSRILADYLKVIA